MMISVARAARIEGHARERRPALARLVASAPWTWLIVTVLIALNIGLARGAPELASELVRVLELDREAVASGEIWRLVTGSLVHWSVAHLLLDVGAFLVIGMLCERAIGRGYPWMLLASAIGVGVAVWLFAPDVSWYRGLSGVASGQFAVAALGQTLAARSRGERVASLAALGILAVKLAYECATGEMLLGTEGLGDIGEPCPLAHAAGTAGAVVAWGAMRMRGRRDARLA